MWCTKMIAGPKYQIGWLKKSFEQFKSGNTNSVVRKDDEINRQAR